MIGTLSITPQCHVDGPELLSIVAIMPLLTLPITTFAHRGPLHEIRISANHSR